MGEGGVDGFALLIKVSILRDCYLQHTNFRILSDKDLVIENAVIPVHVLGKQGRVKALSVLTSLLRLLGLDAALIGWLNG